VLVQGQGRGEHSCQFFSDDFPLRVGCEIRLCHGGTIALSAAEDAGMDVFLGSGVPFFCVKGTTALVEFAVGHGFIPP
jgi:hypothetical protein